MKARTILKANTLSKLENPSAQINEIVYFILFYYV